MLGSALFRLLAGREDLEVFATKRGANRLPKNVIAGVDANVFDSVEKAIAAARPGVVINCIGIIKQLPEAKDPLVSIYINSLFPHKLAGACKNAGARLIHVGTDCVFSGAKGDYTEKDRPDADDLYGRTKFLGEVDYPHAVTLRTSIIGHEDKTTHGLLEWFLAQKGKVKGFSGAIFTGFTTFELAKIIAEKVIPDPGLSGLYHVSSDPISKYDLLKKIRRAYGAKAAIENDNKFKCDRSLDSTRFRKATGYRPPPWDILVEKMHDDFLNMEGRRHSAGGKTAKLEGRK